MCKMTLKPLRIENHYKSPFIKKPFNILLILNYFIKTLQIQINRWSEINKIYPIYRKFQINSKIKSIAVFCNFLSPFQMSLAKKYYRKWQIKKHNKYGSCTRSLPTAAVHSSYSPATFPQLYFDFTFIFTQKF